MAHRPMGGLFPPTTIPDIKKGFTSQVLHTTITMAAEEENDGVFKHSSKEESSITEFWGRAFGCHGLW